MSQDDDTDDKNTVSLPQHPKIKYRPSTLTDRAPVLTAPGWPFFAQLMTITCDDSANHPGLHGCSERVSSVPRAPQPWSLSQLWTCSSRGR